MNPPQAETMLPTTADGHTTYGDQRVYGLIEWDGSYRPTVIVGCCWPAVLHDIIAIITGWVAGGGRLGSDDFQQQHPIPDPNDPSVVLADWLAALREDTTVPYVTLMEPADLVHTGDPLIILDRLAANPCVSRPLGAAGTHRLETRRSPLPAPAGPPALVNGYPVVAAVADGQDATSWIVICRRTQRMPAWAAGTSWYVTWRTSWDGRRWTGENGDYGPHHGLTWPQAQQSLASRLNLPAATPVADPAVYLHCDDDRDSWNCPTCHQPIVEVFDSDTIGCLLTAIAAHRCAPASSSSPPDPQHTIANQ